MLEIYRNTWPVHVRVLVEQGTQDCRDAANAELFSHGITLMAIGMDSVVAKNLKEARARCHFLAATDPRNRDEWVRVAKDLPRWIGARANIKTETRAQWLRRQANALMREAERAAEKTDE